MQAAEAAKAKEEKEEATKKARERIAAAAAEKQGGEGGGGSGDMDDVREAMRERMKTTVVVYLRDGNVMWRKRSMMPAPSMDAAW